MIQLLAPCTSKASEGKGLPLSLLRVSRSRGEYRGVTRSLAPCTSKALKGLFTVLSVSRLSRSRGGYTVAHITLAPLRTSNTSVPPKTSERFQFVLPGGRDDVAHNEEAPSPLGGTVRCDLGGRESPVTAVRPAVANGAARRIRMRHLNNSE